MTSFWWRHQITSPKYVIKITSQNFSIFKPPLLAKSWLRPYSRPLPLTGKQIINIFVCMFSVYVWFIMIFCVFQTKRILFFLSCYLQNTLQNSVWFIYLFLAVCPSPQVTTLDLIFLLDGSSSVGSMNFQSVLSWVQNVASNFLQVRSSRIGVIQYTSK